MADSSFAEIWRLLEREVDSRNHQLHGRYETAFGDLSAAIQVAAGAVQQAVMLPATSGDVSCLRALVEGPGTRLFFEPVRSFRKTRPQEKALDAIEGHETGLDDLVRRLPQTINLSGPELVEALGPYIGSPVRRYLLRRRSRVGFPLRRIVELQFLTEAVERSVLDGGICLALAQSSLLLAAPWQDYRLYALRGLAGQNVEGREWDRSRSRWLREVAALRGLAEVRLSDFRAWTGGAVGRLAAAILRGRSPDTGGRGQKLLLRHQKNFRYWSRQQRAVIALLDLEWELAEMLGEISGMAADTLDSIDHEQTALIGELDSVITWLGEAQGENVRGDFPPPMARLATAEDRVGAWNGLVARSLRDHLPLHVETLEPRSELPRRTEPWRRLEPCRQFLDAVTRLGRPVILEGFHEVELAHRAIVRVIERAREVVRFSMETSQGGPAEAAAVRREGLANALSLVVYQKGAAIDPHAAAERNLVRGIAGSFLMAHLAIEQRRLGLLNQLVRQSGSRAARELGKVILERIAAAGAWLRDYLRKRYHWLLLRIGWEAAQIPIQAPVVARGYVGEVLSLQLGARDLPMIYRRLFRLAPVEEPRFLVGRETEMAALAHARDLWQSGRSVSVILVGNRGSGKTSLLNCAVTREFSGIEVIRSQFSQRITSAAGMRQFVHQLAGVPAGQDLMEGLLARKRIIMLEELERTFLRRMNGFGGLEELLSIVSGSSPGILWILAANQHSYRYLDAATSLGQYFSHRINAMAIPPDHLKSAILLRHNLSGLRIQYPAVPDSGDRRRAMRRLLGLEPNAEDNFFDALYRRSEGIFRSAFELWQHFMERVEGGVLYMQQPAEPDYEPLIAQFSQPDAFTLQAILQHGALTAEEHAEIFEFPLAQSRVLLEKLVHLECLEPDPAGPGLRIRPEAGRLIHVTLHRLNLI